ncbi:uncharacterized protein LOC110447685 [Mizuhopecten yessoensis]|uniref:uncharacterized protein LOC110447685 n=1 Tax=Mizuhopecten yessoensis TaxID=6573 RepID=UPI000B45D15E|nr:uncharacterized protein LOC110447685 [Mizuhopecten yessoensis]
MPLFSMFCGPRRGLSTGFILVTMCFLWLCGAPTGNSQIGAPECPYLSTGTEITEDMVKEGCRGRQTIICKYLVAIQRYRGEATRLLTHICHDYVRSEPKCAWLQSVQANNRYMIDHLYNSFRGLTAILEDSIEIDTMAKELLFQYLGSQSSTKLPFFSFMDILMQPLEYKLSTINAFVNEGHSERMPFMERAGIQEIIVLSIENLIQVLSELDTNFNISFNEIHEERNMALFYLKMFSANASLFDIGVLNNPSHSEYAATYPGYLRRAEKYPRTWETVMRKIHDALRNDINTIGTIWIPNERSILQRKYTWRPVDVVDMYRTVLSKLHSTLDKYPDPDYFLFELQSIFPFTLIGIHQIKSTSKVIEQKEMKINELAKEKDWLEVQFQMYVLIKTYSKFVEKLSDVRAGLLAEKNISQTSLEKFSENCTSGFRDILDILLSHSTKGPHITNRYGTLTLGELQDIHTQTNGFQNQNIFINQEQKLLPWIKFEFSLQRLEVWMKSRLLLYKEIHTSSNEKQSVSNIMKSIEMKTCQDGGTLLTLDTIVSPEDMLCTLAIIRLDCLEYDSYPLHTLREKCGSSFSLLNQMVTRRKEMLLEQEVRSAVRRQGVEDPGSIYDSIFNKIEHDVMSRKYGLSVSQTDILLAVARLYPEKKQFGFYQLSFFRQHHQFFTEGVVEIISSYAIHQRNAEMERIFRKHFCEDHGFCVEHQTPVLNFTSKQVYEKAYVALEEHFTPLIPARKNDQVSITQLSHVKTLTVLALLVCHFLKQGVQ